MSTREDLTFVSGGERCAAWWYPAEGAGAPAPVVVPAHGLSGTRRDRLGAFAERFAAAGFAAFVFDHRGFGDSEGEPDLFRPARQLEDWRAAIAFVRARPDVDAGRVVTFGSSMGGGNALAAGRRGHAGRRRDQSGAIPRHRHPSASRLADRHAADAVRGRARRPSARRGATARGGLHQRATQRTGVAARGRDRRGLTMAGSGQRAVAARTPFPTGTRREDPALSMAGVRRRRGPGRRAGTRDPGRAPRTAR
ncbi:alpha/beta hydrolase [Nocardia sp. NEAU-351]|uniref:Alpha/beta hydrolase n=1 Tax=Nocardia bovistercoris TaxID=2785916 RepID=A0A931ID63_9NOCA|nr:alpha/beta hydrolase [Nocardia bovistercoris]